MAWVGAINCNGGSNAPFVRGSFSRKLCNGGQTFAFDKIAFADAAGDIGIGSHRPAGGGVIAINKMGEIRPQARIGCLHWGQVREPGMNDPDVFTIPFIISFRQQESGRFSYVCRW